MNTRALPLLPIGVLLVLVILTFWLSQFAQPANTNNGKLRHDPESIVEKFVAKKMSATGDIQYILTADKMTHYPDDDSSEMENVLLTATEPDKPEVTIRAPKAKQINAGDEIKMEGGVVMLSAQSKKYQPMRFTTPTLMVYPNKYLARSTTGVLFQTPTTRVNAATFEFNSQTRALEMRKVKGTMERAARSDIQSNELKNEGSQK